jgi:hypothetical protein
MTQILSQVDSMLLGRWADAVAFREAMADLEDRLAAGLETAAESLRPWLEEQGYGFLDIESKYARVNVARSGWINRKSKQPWVWFTLDALLPHGYRKVQEDRPLVWVVTRNLERDDRVTFQGHLASKIVGKEADWVNEDCGRDYPLGRYLTAPSDRERLALALAPESLASFARDALTSMFAFGDDVEAALRATRGE